MSQTKVKSGLLNFPDQTDFVKLPSGTTAQRPVSPEEGYTRFNTTTDKLEFFDGVRWVTAGETPPTLTSVDYPGNALAADVAGGETILINGTNFASGISVTIGTTEVSVVTLNSPTQLAITSPALSAGDYDVKVTNLDGSTITALDFISYNGVPSWVTASGSLGSFNFGEAISTITLSATEPDSGVVTYAVTSGALPVGLTLSSSGEITGTMPSGSSETTYSFTVTATDDENQSTDRSFTITGVVPFVNSQNFNAVTYTAQSIPYDVNVGFRPDLIWVKSRTNAYNHGLFDTLRPNGRYLKTNTNEAQSPANDTAFHTLTDNGFTWTESSGGYNSTGDYVAWCWKAGGAAATNTDGTITSQVSSNTESGFSIITFTGNGSESTVGHGLGKTPDFIIVKNITSDTENSWAVWNKTQSSQSQFLALNSTDSYLTNSGVFGSTPHNSSVFNVGNLRSRNLIDYVAYCFSEIEGFSKFGSYVGNGSTEGNVILTGFEPAFLLIKRTNGANDWILYDNKRDPSNPRDTKLSPNTSNAEYTAAGINIDFLENGFQLKGNDPAINYSVGNGEYIYMAFATDPNTQVPTKADSFNTVLYSGNDGTQSVSGVGFKTDFTITKTRAGAAYDHRVIDSVRGLKKDLYLNLNFIENNYPPDTYGYIQNITSDGYQVVDGTAGADAYNQINIDYVSWNWKAGGTPSINTDGSTTSVVSANKASGFSIVSYTGDGSVKTVGHGLGLAPSMIIVKSRSAVGNWGVYHIETGLDYVSYLDLNVIPDFASNYWGVVDSSVFGVNASYGYKTNQNGVSYIAYCFSEISGFSKIGSFIGNRPASNSITTGFEPAFLLIKNTSNPNEDWGIVDNKRFGAGAPNKLLYASNLNSEDNYTAISFTSTGFVVGDTGLANTNGSKIIYMAFANQF